MVSDIRRSHPGYFQVTVGLCIAYTGLGVAFLLTQGSAVADHSETYQLISAYVPLAAWGVAYFLLGLTLAVALFIKGVPHGVVRGCCAAGLMLTTFWLVIFFVALATGRMDLPTVIPMFSLAWLVEFAAIREPENGPG